jgi:outer membrane receptor for ferrienterochelin and colicin
MDTGSYTRHNLSLEYKANKWSVIAGVRNFTDKGLPSVSSGFTDRVGNAPLYSGYDYVGRTWFMSGLYQF